MIIVCLPNRIQKKYHFQKPRLLFTDVKLCLLETFFITDLEIKHQSDKIKHQSNQNRSVILLTHDTSGIRKNLTNQKNNSRTGFTTDRREIHTNVD